MSATDNARILDRGYRKFDGERLGTGSAIRSTTWQTTRSIFGLGRKARHKFFPMAILGITYLIVVIQLAAVFLFGNETAEFLTTNSWQQVAPGIVMILFAALVAPDAIVRDQKNGMFSLYMSTPLTKPTYLAAKSFWKKTWPSLKDQGWDYDGKRFFYPPDGYKEYVQKQRRSGKDVKEFFDRIAEVGEYVRQNPGINFVKEEAVAKGVKSASAQSGGATEEEHKTASNEDSKSIAKGKDSKKPAAENEKGEAVVLRTPCSSPKEEPSGPDPNYVVAERP